MTICNLRTDRQQEVFDYSEITTYWNRTCHEGRRRSHWYDAGPDDWNRILETHGEMLHKQWPKLETSHELWQFGMSYGLWLEWGCGGGANVAMLSEYGAAWEVYGVDISAPSLEVCGHEIGAEVKGARGARFVPILIDVDNPEEVLERVPQVDGFLSTSTFQHFPSKGYTERIVRLIPRLVRPGGYVFVQIRRDSPKNPVIDAALPYAQRAMYATVYGVDEFGDLLAAHSVDVERVENVDRGQYSYFFGRVGHPISSHDRG